VTEAGFRDEREQLAAEYALGVLAGKALSDARDLLRKDSAFQADVAGWLGHLAPLLDEVAEAQPSSETWQRVEQRIGAPASANDNQPALRRQLNMWRAIAAGASALAASLAIVVVTQPAPAPPAGADRPAETPTPLVATLGTEGQSGLLVATWDPANRKLIVGAAAGLPADPAHSHELWVIPGDGTPRSLGTMPAAARMHAQLDAPVAGLLQAGATLAISVEPLGGSPTGAPTGPVVASGTLDPA
jgi:anti-sigma-K factor RskA